jgi:hypothetical protein
MLVFTGKYRRHGKYSYLPAFCQPWQIFQNILSWTYTDPCGHFLSNLEMSRKSTDKWSGLGRVSARKLEVRGSIPGWGYSFQPGSAIHDSCNMRAWFQKAIVLAGLSRKGDLVVSQNWPDFSLLWDMGEVNLYRLYREIMLLTAHFSIIQ